MLRGAVEGSVRLDVVQTHEGANMSEAATLLRARAVEVLGVGVYRDQKREHSVSYLRLRGADAEMAATALRNRGYMVLGVHP